MDPQNLKPFLQNKDLTALGLLGFLAILFPAYLASSDFWATYTFTGFVALITFGLYQGIHFQKLHRIFRPFVVTRIVQLLTGAGSIAIFARSFPLMLDQKAYVPYGIFWLLILLLNYQFYSIFHAAKKAKKDFPDRCEFC